jgi:cyclohexyl-isocyanide hydratase
MTNPAADAARPVVAMLLYPGLTCLDLIAPHQALALWCDVHLAWKDAVPVVSDSGVTMHPTTSFADCPRDVDVLFVPGGMRQNQHADDDEVLEFLADRGARARYVTSVCGGSLLLGAAGLLTGYRAATHWAARESLPPLGAEPADGRVVVDRNRITGGGVTAGLDFGLTLLAELLGPDVARLTQLMMEYDPQPPFDAGSPGKAGPELTAAALAQLAGTNAEFAGIAEALVARGWGRARRESPAGVAR